jgi:uncharacterized protein
VSVDGLVHVSQIGRQFEADPREAVRPGERVEARVLKVDVEKRQISLSMKPAPRERRRPSPAATHPRGARRSSPAAAARPGGGTPPPRSPAPPRGKASGPRRSGPPGKPSTPPPSRRPAFNNPFAVLADLKIGKGGARS